MKIPEFYKKYHVDKQYTSVGLFRELNKEFDLVISQYAGFVGQAAKPYLKKGGLLLCNNSHGDASMTSLDPGFELVAVYRRKTDEILKL